MNRRLILGLAPAALALATVAYAQPPAPPPPDGHPHMMMHGQPSAEMKAMHEAMMKQHIEDLKTVLRLRPDQDAALQAFVAAHHPADMEDMRHDMAGPPKPMTTPERLDEMAKHEAAMQAQHEKMRQALSKFYAALSPDQQKVFDALTRLEGHHGGGPMGMHMGMMGMDGPGMRQRVIIRHGGPDGPGDEPD